MFNQNSFFLLWLSYVYIKFSDGQILGLNEGANCSVEKTGQQGVCKLITNCTLPCSDGKNIKCGYFNGIPLVCCPLENRLDRTISAIKCEEYKEFACEKMYFTNVIGRPQIAVNTPRCSHTAIPLIAGGEKASRGEFPHMALVGYNDSDTIVWLCAGTLISEEFVLTAAHCFVDKTLGEPTYVRLGEHDLSRTNDSTTTDLKIIWKQHHPLYIRPQKYHDIGLLKLEREVIFNHTVRPACLTDEPTIPTRKSIATGWGVDENNVRSNVLMKVTVEEFSQNECDDDYGINDKYWSSGISEETQLCFGSHNMTQLNNTCQGDSGGPLQIYHKTHFCTYTIVGVTSFGKPCNANAIPGIYTRVYAYLEWIEKIVWPNE